ncbi:MAG TPA: Wzz/FepE/Etk N-terminal domain-containing protein [Bacteroidota bacterium]|nr:Wzz/FepE/Etk N-terminal domain-containing protein [Bacteroidota bacterium]
MADQSTSAPQAPLSNMRSLFYVEILLRWKNFIIVNTLVIAIITSVICFLLPNWYKSTASILPPKQNDLFGSAVGASSLLKGIAGGKALGSLGKTSSQYSYLAILKSRTTMVAVIDKFKLMSVYDISNNNMDLAIKALEGNVLAEAQDDDNINIEVMDKDPQRAADMANYFVDILNETSLRFGTQEARSNREFIERRLIQCQDDLRRGEDALKSFQEKKEIFISADEKKSSVAAYADLYAMKAKKEIEIAVLEKYVAPDNPALQQSRAELAALSRKVSTFPAAGLEGIRLYREVITQEKILEFLLPIYEQARIDEKKDVPVLLVLDKAVPATRKAKPARALIIIIVTVVVLALSIALVFLFHRIEHIDNAGIGLAQKLKTQTEKVRNRYRIR